MIAVRLKPAPRGRQRVDANGKLTLRPESVTDRSSRPSSRLSDTLQPRGDIDAGSRQVAVGLSPTLPKWMPTRNSIHLSGATPGRLAIDWICLLINRQPPHALLGARSALTESKGIPRGRESDSTCWLGLEASGDGASLFFGPAGACGGGGRGGAVLPFGGQDVHGQRRQRCEVVAAPARRRQSGRAEDGRMGRRLLDRIGQVRTIYCEWVVRKKALTGRASAKREIPIVNISEIAEATNSTEQACPECHVACRCDEVLIAEEYKHLRREKRRSVVKSYGQWILWTRNTLLRPYQTPNVILDQKRPGNEVAPVGANQGSQYIETA